jgi:hypothetical protein
MNLTDCWWQIPPFGKDFHCEWMGKFDELTDKYHFGKNGMKLVWLEAGLGP